MCTKPATAKSSDGMYSWTWPVLQHQILTTRRLAHSNPRVEAVSPVPLGLESQARPE
jgi:hypothetical protein